MINLYHSTPTIYAQASRDFQYLSWLYNIVLNSVKHNVDDLYQLPLNTSQDQLIELLALTLGFKVKRKYDTKQLSAIVTILPSLMKNKGTQHAIQLAGQAIMRASGVEGLFEIKSEGAHLKILLPRTLTDLNLFNDLLPYILPAGCTFRVTQETTTASDIQTKLSLSSTIKTRIAQDITLKQIDGSINDQESLSRLFSPTGTSYDVTYITEDSKPNTGLLGTTVIADRQEAQIKVSAAAVNLDETDETPLNTSEN